MQQGVRSSFSALGMQQDVRGSLPVLKTQQEVRGSFPALETHCTFSDDKGQREWLYLIIQNCIGDCKGVTAQVPTGLGVGIKWLHTGDLRISKKKKLYCFWHSLHKQAPPGNLPTIQATISPKYRLNYKRQGGVQERRRRNAPVLLES